MIIERGLEVIGAFLKERFIAELLAQNHSASGDHIDSIKYEVEKTGDGFELVFTHLKYGDTLETGTSAGRYVPIAALMDWIETKGIATGEIDIKRAAFAIRQAIYNEGTPTSGSYKHSKNGRRTEWITQTIEENKVKINEKLVLIVGQNVNATLKNLATNINKG